MSSTEEYLKDHICEKCHICILDAHPEEKFALQGYFKCNCCGFTKKIIKEIKHGK